MLPSIFVFPPSPPPAAVCPADCSGHGVCKLLSDLDTSVPYSIDNWDAKRIQACVCDAGFGGPDCSQRE